MIRLGPTPEGGDTEVGELLGFGDPLWKERVLNHILGTPGPQSDTRKTNPLHWFEDKWDWQGGCEKLELHSLRACTCLLVPKTRQRKQTETAWDSSCFPQPPQYTPWPVLLCHTAPH